MEFKDLNDKQQSAYLVLSSKKILRISCDDVERILYDIRDLEKKLKEANKRRKEDFKDYYRLNKKYPYSLSNLSEKEKQEVEELVEKEYSCWDLR